MACVYAVVVAIARWIADSSSTRRGSGGNRFVRPLLTASSVITVMQACMLMVPNPGSRNEWPAHCDGGIHYLWPFKFGIHCVWPCKLGAELAIVIVFAIAAHIPRKQNKAAKLHP